MIVRERLHEVLIAGEAEGLGILDDAINIALKEPLPFALTLRLLAQRFCEDATGDTRFDLDFQLVA